MNKWHLKIRSIFSQWSLFFFFHHLTQHLFLYSISIQNQLQNCKSFHSFSANSHILFLCCSFKWKKKSSFYPMWIIQFFLHKFTYYRLLYGAILSNLYKFLFDTRKIYTNERNLSFPPNLTALVIALVFFLRPLFLLPFLLRKHIGSCFVHTHSIRLSLSLSLQHNTLCWVVHYDKWHNNNLQPKKWKITHLKSQIINYTNNYSKK